MKNYLKKRLIPVVLINNGQVVQSFKFSEYKIVGQPIETIKRLNQYGSDEIIILDITKNRNYSSYRKEDNLKHYKNFFELIENVSKINFVPLAAGGGIRDITDIETFLKKGCDKVVINTMCIKRIDLVNKASKIFGSQCLIGSIDYIEEGNERYVVENSNKVTNLRVSEFVDKLKNNGIGEIFLNSITRDGLRLGYDIEFLKNIVKKKLPVIPCGGAGSWEDMFKLVNKTDCSAVAASNIFHHMEHSTFIAKQFLYDKKLNFRKSEFFGE
jgi:imidazole glycerol-phosphate synthase subunit HisF